MKKLFLPLFVLVILFGCSDSSPSEVVEIEKEIEIIENEEIEDIEIKMMLDDITITGNNRATPYPEAYLALSSFDENTMVVGENQFAFDVGTYNLTEPTDDDYAVMCANSAKGQHIHFIMDNAPYLAWYEDEGTVELEEGHHVLLAFLSRSYHMSVKSAGASVIQEFNVGDGEYEDNFDETSAHLFYSRPKGTYTGLDAERVLLDFYLYNADLGKDAYRVRATINGTEFVFYDWLPYVMEGLPMGTNTVKLELLDSENNLVESPFNPVERTFELVAE